MTAATNYKPSSRADLITRRTYSRPLDKEGKVFAPVGVVEYDYYPDGFPKGQWGNLTQSFMIAEGTLLYTSPQPTPQDVIDAERWRWFIENWGEPHVEQAIDQAMKNE